jgi:hypothetical protein
VRPAYLEQRPPIHILPEVEAFDAVIHLGDISYPSH